MTHVAIASKKPLQIWYGSLGFLGGFHLLALLAPWFFSWSALGVALFLHWLTGSIGICLGYHRLLTHRSLRVPQWLEYILATIGALALQGSPMFWVSSHRLHHAHTEDADRDPHSASKGFWWSHVLWLLYKRPQFFDYEQFRKTVPDLDRQAYYRWLGRNYLLLQALLGILLYALGSWNFVIYGIFVRVVVLWHCTWFVNSATHFLGYKTFSIEDGSRNLWWVSLLTYGEGWHNNHHSHPRVAKAGYSWWEIDSTWWVIRLLQVLGLAKKVVLPSAN